MKSYNDVVAFWKILFLRWGRRLSVSSLIYQKDGTSGRGEMEAIVQNMYRARDGVKGVSFSLDTEKAGRKLREEGFRYIVDKKEG